MNFKKMRQLFLILFFCQIIYVTAQTPIEGQWHMWTDVLGQGGHLLDIDSDTITFYAWACGSACYKINKYKYLLVGEDSIKVQDEAGWHDVTYTIAHDVTVDFSSVSGQFDQLSTYSFPPEANLPVQYPFMYLNWSFNPSDLPICDYFQGDFIDIINGINDTISGNDTIAVGGDGISDTTSTSDTVSTIADERELMGVSIYPNPFNESVQLHFNENVRSYSLFDFHGRIVRQKNNVNNIEHIRKGNLKPGLYFLRIEGDKNSEIQKIVIE